MCKILVILEVYGLIRVSAENDTSYKGISNELSRLQVLDITRDAAFPYSLRCVGL